MKQLSNEIQPKYLIPAGYKSLYEMPFKEVYLDENNKSLLSVWNLKSEMINNEMYKEDCLKILEMVIKYSIKSFISDVTMNRFAIPPESQKWYAQEVAIKLDEAGLKKCAIIVENDLTIMGSFEEIANSASKEKDGEFIPLRFFSTLRDAHDWAIR